MTPLLTDTLESPLGRLVLVFDAGRLCLLDYADNTERMTRLLRQRYHRFRLCAALHTPRRDTTAQGLPRRQTQRDRTLFRWTPAELRFNKKSGRDAPHYSTRNHPNLP